MLRHEVSNDHNNGLWCNSFKSRGIHFFCLLTRVGQKKNQGNLTLFDLTNSPYGCVHVTNGTDEEKFVCTAFENFYRGASLIPKPCWRKELIPIQRTKVLAKAWNRHGTLLIRFPMSQIRIRFLITSQS